MNSEVGKCFLRFKKIFPKSFIYKENELIVEPKNNIYFRVDNISDELGFKCKVLEYLSRPSCKGVSKWYQDRIRKGANKFLETNFSFEDWQKIYTYLGNECNRGKTIRFIQSGYDFLTLNMDKP